jgi:hypothetical protein
VTGLTQAEQEVLLTLSQYSMGEQGTFYTKSVELVLWSPLGLPPTAVRSASLSLWTVDGAVNTFEMLSPWATGLPRAL